MVRHLPPAALLGLATFGLVYWRILALGQAADARAASIAGLMAVGSFIALPAVFAMSRRVAARYGRPAAAITAALLAPPACLAGAAIAFAVYDRWLIGHIDLDASHRNIVVTLVWSHASSIYLFAVSGLNFLLPMPLLVLALAAGLIGWHAGAGPD
jgi:hypothetical protein